VVPIVNIKGVKPGELKLSSAVLTDIFLGKITLWNDPAITALNSGVDLPEQDIMVVHRADGSGTTNIFTHYLNQVSTEWAQQVGVGKSVGWPVGIGGKGNEGISAYVRKVKGSIGYVEYAYALLNRLAYVSLQNKDGEFVQPTIESFQAAASNADWKNSPGFYMFLTDQPGKESWPITGVTYILLHAQQPRAEIARAMLEFFEWCYEEGIDTAEQLHYVPIPENVVTMIKELWSQKVIADGVAVWPTQ
jgi:phosphate transport system substrate-binding protein